jgi:catechol 2,3-dioxygenase-like lactoylglutathione lyase family enzyme
MTFELDHIHIRCQDLETSVDYYANMFGGEVVARLEVRGMPLVRIKIGQTFLALSPKREELDVEPLSGNPRWGAYELGFLVEDVEQAFQELKAKGAEFIAGPLSPRPGVQIAFLEAPDGVQIEILHRD